MKSAFWPFDGRLRIINEQIKPGFARLRAKRRGGDRHRLTEGAGRIGVFSETAYLRLAPMEIAA